MFTDCTKSTMTYKVKDENGTYAHTVENIASIEECMWICLKNQTCHYYQYLSNTNMCTIFNGNAPEVIVLLSYDHKYRTA